MAMRTCFNVNNNLFYVQESSGRITMDHIPSMLDISKDMLCMKSRRRITQRMNPMGVQQALCGRNPGKDGASCKGKSSRASKGAGHPSTDSKLAEEHRSKEQPDLPESRA